MWNGKDEIASLVDPNRFSLLFGIVDDGFGAFGNAVPKYKNFIGLIDDYFIAADWSGPAVFVILRPDNQFGEFVVIGILFRNSVYPIGPTGYDKGGFRRYIFIQTERLDGAGTNNSKVS